MFLAPLYRRNWDLESWVMIKITQLYIYLAITKRKMKIDTDCMPVTHETICEHFMYVLSLSPHAVL